MKKGQRDAKYSRVADIFGTDNTSNKTELTEKFRRVEYDPQVENIVTYKE
jgi:hypothetical protein